MKTTILLLLALASFAASAAEMTLQCRGYRNYEILLENEVRIGDLEKNIQVGELEEYQIIVSSLGNDKIELQGYNMSEPSRTYATTTMAKAGDMIELAVWKREFLLEVKCAR